METGQHIRHCYKICLQKLDSTKGDNFCHKVDNLLLSFNAVAQLWTVIVQPANVSVFLLFCKCLTKFREKAFGLRSSG